MPRRITRPTSVAPTSRRDPRFRYFRNAENVGAIRNYRCCFEPARAKYFKWANYDYIYTPSFLERCVDILDRHPDIVLAYTMVDAVDFTGRDLLKEHRDYAREVIESSRDNEGRLVWVIRPLHFAEVNLAYKALLRLLVARSRSRNRVFRSHPCRHSTYGNVGILLRLRRGACARTGAPWALSPGRGAVLHQPASPRLCPAFAGQAN